MFLQCISEFDENVSSITSTNATQLETTESSGEGIIFAHLTVEFVVYTFYFSL